MQALCSGCVVEFGEEVEPRGVSAAWHSPCQGTTCDHQVGKNENRFTLPMVDMVGAYTTRPLHDRVVLEEPHGSRVATVPLGQLR